MNTAPGFLKSVSDDVKVVKLWLQLERGLNRISELIQFAKDRGLKLLVDAEYTYMNPGISAVALVSML